MLWAVLDLIGQAQWRWDFVSASHGGSFHAPPECDRIFGNSIERSEHYIHNATLNIEICG